MMISNNRQRPLSMHRSKLLGVVIGSALSTLSSVNAAPPSWWYDRGVVDITLQANDYAAVNQGQVKFIAEQAAAEMDAHLPGGAGDVVHTFVASWGSPTALTNDFTAVNLGQLKALAEPFYQRLVYAKYTNTFPWNPNQSLINNYAAANIGQVKNLFSFDLTSTDAAHDTNEDGLPDWWETFYQVPIGKHATDAVPWNPNLTYLQALQQGLNPTDFYDGRAPSFAGSSGENQTGALGEFLPLPLTVSVTVNGQPAINSPIAFIVTQGGGQVQRSSNSTPCPSITVLTDYNGLAKVYYRLSTIATDQNLVTAKPGSGKYNSPIHLYPQAVNLTASTNSSPFAPTNVVVTYSPDGSADYTWTSNVDPSDTTLVPIQDLDEQGNLTTLAWVPANSSSYHLPAN